MRIEVRVLRALCSFNPIYGQGMTAAALQALALRDRLTGEDHDVRRVFRELERSTRRGSLR